MKVKMRKLLTTIALAALPLLEAAAQDIHFSQFYENAILRNPALTGIFSGDYKAGVNYRAQWGALTMPFQTIVASAESRVRVDRELNDYLSFGFCASYDHAGSIDFNSLQLTPAINYNKSLNDRHASYLSLGFEASYIQRSVDPSKMTLDNQYIAGYFVPNATTGEQLTFNKISHFDLSAGVSFNSTIGEEGQVVYYVGAAVFHATRPMESFNKENFVRLSPRFSTNFGLRARVTDELGFTLLANYTNQHPNQETIFGGLLHWNTTLSPTRRFALYTGCFFRLNDAVIPTVKMDYNTYSFTVSYDVVTSSLRPAVNAQGGWEFSFYVRGKRKKVDYLNQVTCPSFEPGQMSESNNK